MFPSWKPVTVPKIAVDEDCDFLFGEGNVRLTGQVFEVGFEL